jgi:hypothetical protein
MMDLWHFFDNKLGGKMNSYIGLYVQKLENGQIYSVQVQDTGGNTIPLEPRTYIERIWTPLILQAYFTSGY